MKLPVGTHLRGIVETCEATFILARFYYMKRDMGAIYMKRANTFSMDFTEFFADLQSFCFSGAPG